MILRLKRRGLYPDPHVFQLLDPDPDLGTKKLHEVLKMQSEIRLKMKETQKILV